MWSLCTSTGYITMKLALALLMVVFTQEVMIVFVGNVQRDPLLPSIPSEGYK